MEWGHYYYVDADAQDLATQAQYYHAEGQQYVPEYVPVQASTYQEYVSYDAQASGSEQQEAHVGYAAAAYRNWHEQAQAYAYNWYASQSSHQHTSGEQQTSHNHAGDEHANSVLKRLSYPTQQSKAKPKLASTIGEVRHATRSSKPSTDSSGLAGAIFGCTNETESECLNRMLFASPNNPQSLSLMARIEPGIMVFLYNFNTKSFHGVFEAITKGGNYEPSAFKGRYPCQVRVRRLSYYAPLKEAMVKSALKYFSTHKFNFSLDNKQVAKFLDAFAASAGADPVTGANEVSMTQADLQGTVSAPRTSQPVPRSAGGIALPMEGTTTTGLPVEPVVFGDEEKRKAREWFAKYERSPQMASAVTRTDSRIAKADSDQPRGVKEKPTVPTDPPNTCGTSTPESNDAADEQVMGATADDRNASRHSIPHQAASSSHGSPVKVQGQNALRPSSMSGGTPSAFWAPVRLSTPPGGVSSVNTAVSDDNAAAATSALVAHAKADASPPSKPMEPACVLSTESLGADVLVEEAQPADTGVKETSSLAGGDVSVKRRADALESSNDSKRLRMESIPAPADVADKSAELEQRTVKAEPHNGQAPMGTETLALAPGQVDATCAVQSPSDVPARESVPSVSAEQAAAGNGVQVTSTSPETTLAPSVMETCSPQNALQGTVKAEEAGSPLPAQNMS
eukprot:jgi/Chlat1/6891/Chrsp51S06572